MNLLAFLVVFCFTDPLLLAFGAGTESLPFAHAYLWHLAWGVPFSNMLLMLNASLQRYGGDRAVAAMALFGMPLLVLMNLCLGLSHGAQPIVSYNYGSGRLDRVREVNCRFMQASFACSFVLWGVAMVAPDLLWRGFTSDPDLLRFATGQTRLFFAVLLLGGVQYAQIYIIKFLGDVRISLFLGVLKRLVLLLPLIFILPAVLSCGKTTAVLLASPVSEALAFAITVVCYLQLMNRIKKKGVQ